MKMDMQHLLVMFFLWASWTMCTAFLLFLAAIGVESNHHGNMLPICFITGIGLAYMWSIRPWLNE